MAATQRALRVARIVVSVIAAGVAAVLLVLVLMLAGGSEMDSSIVPAMSIPGLALVVALLALRAFERRAAPSEQDDPPRA